ncbi:MAG: amidohydrolase family protein [Acidimicrobiia bacterium]|nr:amidohydrolase family protein [Acidimicrobiia bacterium]
MRGNKVGEMRFEGETVPPRSASEYFAQSCFVGISQPTPADISAGMDILGIDKMMWGNDYPHEEGTHPFTREHLRQVLGHLEPTQIQQILAGNAAEFYNFDLKALQPFADKYGPTVGEIAVPLTSLPSGANQALERSAAQLSKAG